MKKIKSLDQKQIDEKKEAMDIAEDSRQKDWHYPSFMAELFKGNFRWDLMCSYPKQDPKDKKEGDLFIVKLEKCLKKNIDPAEVDKNGKLPPQALKELAKIGAFGMKISKTYGGLGLSVVNYTRAVAFTSTYCASTAVWLSAHQSIGVPQPLKLFGTAAQKKKYLPQFAKGAISAFALTEPNVGSDPAKMMTTAKFSKDDKFYLLNGIKQWCTNGPSADIIIVMALTAPKIIRGKEKKQISAFIVETKTPGFKVLHRCQFMGIRGISNGLLSFKNVKVPVENRIGKEGEGLKISFVTLNAGRLAIPACSAAAGKWCMNVSRNWANNRVQWGNPIGKHQAIAKKLANMSADTFAMESMAFWTAFMADKEKVDIRLEAACAKYYASEAAWNIVDETLQIRGGRGFETDSSLKARGEEGIPVERVLRDIRINRIIEGTSEIMQLFIAREAVDMHFRMAKPLLTPHNVFSSKITALIKMGFFYFFWYPRQWICLPFFKRVKMLNGENKKHLSYIKKISKKLAKSVFHSMVRFGPSLERQQLILANHVDIGVNLFTMATMLSKTEYECHQQKKNKQSIQSLCDFYCINARERIKNSFHQIRFKNYKKMEKVNHSFLKGDFKWLEEGILKYSSK